MTANAMALGKGKAYTQLAPIQKCMATNEIRVEANVYPAVSPGLIA